MKNLLSSREVLVLNLLLVLALQSATALAQKKMSAEDAALYGNRVKSTGMDPGAQRAVARQSEKTQNWSDAKVIHYHIVGAYQGEPNITSDPGRGSGFAQVTDRVEIDLDWDPSTSTLIGKPHIENSPSVVKNPRDAERSCLPPVLRGEYEHYDLLGVKDGLGGTLELQVHTTYPKVDVAQVCSGSRKTIPAGSKTRPEELAVPSPVMFGMALPDSDNLRISPDRKSMIQKKAGWTWTFTPSIIK